MDWNAWKLAARLWIERCRSAHRPNSVDRGSIRQLKLQRLEDRILLSAAPVAAVEDAAGLALHEPTTVDVAQLEPGTTTEISRPVDARTPNSAPVTLRHELVFVNGDVDDYRQLLDGIAADAQTNRDFVVLDADRNGIEQITDILQSYRDLDAVHIVSHGSQGQVKLGDTWLTASSLGDNVGALAGWGWSFNRGADLLFYGCDLASSDAGQQLMQDLSALTGADVAASVDDTGAESLGGDWELEYVLGEVTSAGLFSTQLQQSWQHVLATDTVRDEFRRLPR